MGRWNGCCEKWRVNFVAYLTDIVWMQRGNYGSTRNKWPTSFVFSINVAGSRCPTCLESHYYGKFVRRFDKNILVLMTFRKSLLISLLLMPSLCLAQMLMHDPARLSLRGSEADISIPSPTAVALPRMAPELALREYERRADDQRTRLTGIEDETVITAELPDSEQKGEFQLRRTYTANPPSLQYRTINYSGDGFVKTNVIGRVLQSEVDHVQKGDQAATAVNHQNYKFLYKGVELVRGIETHVFQLKPRRKQAGLIKGKIYLDTHSGSILRMEGSTAKSPSFFIRKLEFVQDFDDIDGFTMPTKLHSTTKARIIGRTVVDIVHKAYRLQASNSAVPVVAGGRD